MRSKNDIKNLTQNELKKELAKVKEPSYRAKQIFRWVYKKGISHFADIKNIPGVLKGKLEDKFFISILKLSEHFTSTDGTEKFLFELADGNFVETVLIKANKRKTVCLSTQVGCKFHCPFCASGRMGFVRDLLPSEITGQILYLRHGSKHEITNYVFMGMGEPLDNYENTSRAIHIMNDPEGMAIGARRITLSTCGIVPGIKKLEKLGLQINLSISLHATNDDLRNKLVPVNREYPIERLIKALEDYTEKKGRMITLEYALMDCKNDSDKEADKLAQIATRLKAKVNLIPYSGISGGGFKPSREERIKAFLEYLLGKNVKTTLRKSKGEDIKAACGQLAGCRVL